VRLFIAVSPPEDVRSHLAAELSRHRELLDGARPVRPVQWHLTLAFLADVPEAKVADVRAALSVAAGSVAPFTLELTGAGAFGRDRAVIWTGLAGQVDKLERFARLLRGGLVAAGLPLDSRSFTPHLTVARNVDLRRPAASAALAELNAYRGPQWTVEQVELVHSRLGADPGGGARHEPLGVWELGRPGK
jgi:RNA 2',3'-cyclic 3'-phosphodiesterase